jgi:parallel beta helix pectate lyase-like protein
MANSARSAMAPALYARRQTFGHGKNALRACVVIGLIAAGCSSAGESKPSGCAADVCSPSDGGSPIRESGGGSNGDARPDARGDGARDAPAPSCSFDGKTIASGSSVTAYQASSVAPGNLCVSESRTCSDGVLSGTYGYASCSVTTVPAFYVSPSGNDGNPGTIAEPFLTLGKAQSAMQGSTSVKTTYLRAGMYGLSASSGTSNCYGGKGSSAINLGSTDDGETWSYYPPDGFASAVIDGGSTSPTTGVACAFAANNASNLTFIGLEFQHLQYSAIYANSSSSLMASDNTIHDLTVAVFNVGGVALHSSSGATVKNNYIHDVAYMGVGAWGGGMSNTTISGNVILNSCTAAAQPGGDDQDGGDCGAIYTWDESHASTNILVTNNYVRDVNVSSNGEGDYGGCCATGIYVDDGMSNVTVSGNVVTGIKSQCFVIHGGNNNTYTDNLCDLDDSMYQRIMTYQWDSLMLPMTGNSIENNIIVSSSTGAGTGYSDNGTPTAPTIKNNAYFNYVGTTIDSSGSNGSDANPTYENPGISCWDPTISATSPVYDSPVSFTKLVGGWGPPGFVLPQTGTPPSWPHGC